MSYPGCEMVIVIVVSVSVVLSQNLYKRINKAKSEGIPYFGASHLTMLLHCRELEQYFPVKTTAESCIYLL